MKAKIYKTILIAAALAIMPAHTVYATERNAIMQDDPVPLDVRIACEVWGNQYNICPELLEAIAYHESRFVSDAENGTCKGLMQINVKCHKERAQALDVQDINNVEENIMLAADYLHELFEEYEDVGVVLTLYHGEKDGQARAERGELSPYVCKILKTSAEFERLHGY